MTFADLGVYTIEQLEALSDSQVEEVFAPYFNVTRPVKKVEEKSTKKLVTKADVVKEVKRRAGMKGLTPEAIARLERMNALLDSGE